jgi:hypothetical protein
MMTLRNLNLNMNAASSPLSQLEALIRGRRRKVRTWVVGIIFTSFSNPASMA